MNDTDMRVKLMLKYLDRTKLHTSAIAILQNPAYSLKQATAMIANLERESELYDDEEGDDMQDIIDEDNRDRAADMNAVGRSYY